MTPITEISTQFSIADHYIAILVEAGFVVGQTAENIEDYNIDKESFEKWFEKRQNGWRLPSPPELFNIIENRKNNINYNP